MVRERWWPGRRELSPLRKCSPGNRFLVRWCRPGRRDLIPLLSCRHGVPWCTIFAACWRSSVCVQVSVNYLRFADARVMTAGGRWCTSVGGQVAAIYLRCSGVRLVSAGDRALVARSPRFASRTQCLLGGRALVLVDA